MTFSVGIMAIKVWGNATKCLGLPHKTNKQHNKFTNILMEQHTTTTAAATAIAKTTILDIPTDCWNLILSKLQTPHHNQIYIHHNRIFTHHHTHIYSLTLTCKHLLSITNTHPCSLAFTRLLPDHLTSVLPPLLRRFSASLQTLSFTDSSSVTVDAALSFIVTSNATAHLHALHLRDLYVLPGLPVEGLRHLGSNPNNIKVLTLSRIKRLSDQQLVAVCLAFPLIEEIDVSLNKLSDVGISGLAQNLKFLRKIDLSGNVLITDKSMIALSDCCLDLTDVEVHGCSLFTEYGIGYVMRHSTKLSRLSIRPIRGAMWKKSDSLFNIENSIGFCRNLSKLGFYSMNVVEDTLLCSIAKAALPLTQFAMSDRTKSARASLREFSTLISAYPKIQKLDVTYERCMTDEVMKGLVRYLGNLVVINVGNCIRLTTLTFQMLLKNCPALEEMNAKTTQLGNGELDEPLVKVNNIKCLKISFNPLLMDELLEKIGIMCPNLEHLDVCFCSNLTSKGIRKLLNCCRGLKQLDIEGWVPSVLFGKDFEGTSMNLELLKLRDGNFGDDCISEIAKACPKLLYVNLAKCRGVTAKCVKELVESCTDLRELDLQFCPNVSPETLASVVSARPSLRTITSYTIYSHTHMHSCHEIK